METFELLEKLSEKSKQEIEFALTVLMLKEKIDFVNVSNSYVACLEQIKEDRLNQIIEAETCVLESFHYKKGNKNEDDRKHTQRCLYLLNQSRRFNMGKMNEKYEYDEELGKKMSWYERNKEGTNIL